MRYSNLTLTVAMLSSAFIGSLAGGSIATRHQDTPDMAVSSSQASFDYEACRSIVAKGSLSNPGVPDDWKVIEETPGGNWCVR